MLKKSLIMIVLFDVVNSGRRRWRTRRTPVVTPNPSCTASSCFENKTSANYNSYFDLDNLGIAGWTTTVSSQTFPNLVKLTQNGPQAPDPIPDLCIDSLVSAPQPCTAVAPIVNSADTVTPSDLSFDEYLASFYAASALTGQPQFDSITGNFKNQWDVGGTIGVVASGMIGTNEVNNEKQEYVYFAPWQNSITSITYQISESGSTYQYLEKFTFNIYGAPSIVLGRTSGATTPFATYTYTPTGKIIGISGKQDSTQNGNTCSLSFAFNLCSCYSSFYFMSDNSLQTVNLEMGVAAQKAFTITDMVTGVFSNQHCGTFLTSAQSVTPNPAFSAAVTPTTGNTSSVTISTTDSQFQGTTQTVIIQVANQGFPTADNPGTYFLPTMTFNMVVVVNCRVYAQSPQITLSAIPTFEYFVYSGTITTPAFESLQKMNFDQAYFCTYDLNYVTSVSLSNSALTLAINQATLTVSLSSTVAYKDTSQTVTVTSSLLPADSTKYVAAGWTYPSNGFQFIVNIKCTVVAFAFTANPIDFSSTEQRANVASATFTASETPQSNSCGYPLTYSYNTLPNWVTYNAATRIFTIESLNSKTGADQTAIITVTATVTLPLGYIGSQSVTVSKSIKATLLACTVDSVQPVSALSLNLAYTLKGSQITPAIVSSAAFTFSQTPACDYPIFVTKTDPISLSSPAVATIAGAYQLQIQTNSYTDEGTHTILVSADVDPGKRSLTYTQTPLNFFLTVTFCLPSYSVVTMPEAITVYSNMASLTTTNSISVVDANSCGFDGFLINNSLKKTDASSAPAWTSLTLATIPSSVSIGQFDSTQLGTYYVNIIGSGNLPNLSNTPIGFTSGTWTLTALSPCEAPSNTFVTQNPTTMTVSALSNVPGQTQLLALYIENYGQSIGNNAYCGTRTYTAQYLDDGNNVWMGTNTGTWIDLTAGFPLQFDQTLMQFTLISNAANQVTTLGAVTVRLNVGLSLYSSPTLVDQFSFTITKCLVTSLTSDNVAAYTPAMINFSIQVPPIAAQSLTHTWTQTPNCLYPFTYQYTVIACPLNNPAPCTSGNNLGFLRTMSFTTNQAEEVNVRPAAPATYTEIGNQLFTNDMTQYGVYSVRITATLADDPNIISAQISSQMNLINICMTTVLIPATIPDTFIFVGEQSSFSFDELKNTQNLLNPVPDCGDLAVVAQLDGLPVSWITVSNIGAHILGNQVFHVKVDGKTISNALSANLTLQASLVNYPSVNVLMTSKLIIYKLIFGQMLAVKYQTNAAEKKVNFNYFLQPEGSPPAFETNAQVIAQGGASVTPYLPSSSIFKITYAPPTFSFLNFQDGNQNVGNYTIAYQIKFPLYPQQDQIWMFNLEIIAPQVAAQINSPPYFTVPNDWPYFKVLSCGLSWKYKIPEIQDDNKGDSGSLAIIDLKQSSSFVSFDYEKSEFQVAPDVLTKKNNGEYQLSALLKDQNGGQTTYVISLQVFCYDFNVTNATIWQAIDSTSNSPIPFITKISGVGRVYIKFSEPLGTVNATNITNGTLIIEGVQRPILGVHVIPEDENKKINYTWECLNFTSDGMELQLYFEEPSTVSYKIPLDKLFLTFWGQPAFKVANRTDYIPYAYNITYNIPAQMDVHSGTALNSLLLNASLATKMNMFGTFFIQVLVSGCLQQIFSAINKLQVIVHMELVNISIPAPASLYCSYLFSILSFSLLPTDDYFDNWFSLPHQDPITSNFGQLGYETIFFLRNLGSVSFFLLFWPLQISCAFLLGKIKHRKAIKWSRKWKKALIWKSLLSYMELQCVLISVSFFLNVIYSTNDDWTQWGQIFNILLGILIGSATCLYPFFQLIMLHKLFPKIRNGNGFIKQRWGYMFEQLHIPLLSSKLKHQNDGKSSINYVFYSKLRQIVMAASVVTLIGQPLFCIFFFNFAALFAMILAGILRPYSLPSKNNSEMINEFAILVLNYHFICLTDFVSDPWTRDIIGYSLCSCISIILICNIFVIGSDLFKQWSQKLRWFLKRRQMIKLLEEKRKMLLLLNEQYIDKVIEDYKRKVYGVKPEPNANVKLRLKKSLVNRDSNVLNRALSEIKEEESENQSEKPQRHAALITLDGTQERRREQSQEQSTVPDFAIAGGADQLVRDAPVQFHRFKKSSAILTEAKFQPFNKVVESIKPKPNYSIQWMEDRVRNLPRVTQEDEEMYWGERQKLSVMRAKNSPFIMTEIM